MKKNIKGIKELQDKVKYIKKKEIDKLKPETEVIAEKAGENNPGKFILVNQVKTKKKKRIFEAKQETPNIKENTECFQLVVIENVAWYKKAIRAIKKFFFKPILVKSGR